MIVLNVTYKCSADQRIRFLEQIWAEGLAEASRNEEGNIQYDYFVPADGGENLLLVEKWRDEDAFEKHKKEPHYKRLGQIKEGFGIGTAMEKFIAD